jgi:hypothetical protein
MEPRRVWRLVVSDSHRCDEDPDPGSHRSNKSEPDPHKCEKRVPDLHRNDADPQYWILVSVNRNVRYKTERSMTMMYKKADFIKSARCYLQEKIIS